MSESNSGHHHRIDYVELAVTDIAEAKRFYGEAFGWSFQDYGPAYASFNDGRLDGGFLLKESVQPGGPLVILYSDDLEASEQAITAAGGAITDRHEFPGGRRLHFSDPSGNHLAVWTDK